MYSSPLYEDEENHVIFTNLHDSLHTFLGKACIYLQFEAKAFLFLVPHN